VEPVKEPTGKTLVSGLPFKSVSRLIPNRVLRAYEGRSEAIPWGVGGFTPRYEILLAYISSVMKFVPGMRFVERHSKDVCCLRRGLKTMFKN
jgi:hypothetical protein